MLSNVQWIFLHHDTIQHGGHIKEELLKMKIRKVIDSMRLEGSEYLSLL